MAITKKGIAAVFSPLSLSALTLIFVAHQMSLWGHEYRGNDNFIIAPVFSTLSLSALTLDFYYPR